jgi:hypothetical protein
LGFFHWIGIHVVSKQISELSVPNLSQKST